MDGFILQIFSGLANGSIYAAVGLALVMIYQGGFKSEVQHPGFQ